MGLVDQLVAQSARANQKQPAITKWLDALDVDARAEWLAVFARVGSGHGQVSVPVCRKALVEHGCQVSDSTVRKWVAAYLPDYQPPD